MVIWLLLCGWQGAELRVYYCRRTFSLGTHHLTPPSLIPSRLLQSLEMTLNVPVLGTFNVQNIVSLIELTPCFRDSRAGGVVVGRLNGVSPRAHQGLTNSGIKQRLVRVDYDCTRHQRALAHPSRRNNPTQIVHPAKLNPYFESTVRHITRSVFFAVFSRYVYRSTVVDVFQGARGGER